jgi:hypothetical protein
MVLILGVLMLVVATGCTGAASADGAVPPSLGAYWLAAERPLGQTFTADEGGLNAVEVYLH